MSAMQGRTAQERLSSFAASGVMSVTKAKVWSIGLAAAASAFFSIGAGGAPTSEGSVPPHAQSVLRCYATSKNPEAAVCYRLSKKAEYRHGQIVYIPMLIQVPTPADPPSVTIVDSLDDIRPNAGPGT